MHAATLAALKEISTLSYFYLQDESMCVGALQYAARTKGIDLSNEEAVALIPELREGLKKVAVAMSDFSHRRVP